MLALNVKITIVASLEDIHLIQFADTSGGASSYARFDSNKSIFLDSIPEGVNSEKAMQQIKELLK